MLEDKGRLAGLVVAVNIFLPVEVLKEKLPSGTLVAPAAKVMLVLFKVLTFISDLNSVDIIARLVGILKPPWNGPTPIMEGGIVLVKVWPAAPVVNVAVYD